MVHIVRKVIPQEAIRMALRAINIDLFETGYSGLQLAEWTQDHAWLPHLWRHPHIQALHAWLPAGWRRHDGELQPPQIVVQPPYYGPPRVPYWHVDEGGKWKWIVGIPLTEWTEQNGGLWVAGAAGDDCPHLYPGDAVRMSGDQEHAVGVNDSGLPRYGVYFRWL